jgi:predicted  nucleic acid-binding Zn-ribbon protein
VQAEVEALLALQEDDRGILELEARRAALDPRLADLDKQRQFGADAMARAQSALEAEEKKRRELEIRVAEHRTLHERNVHQLDQVRRMREATAAVSQVEQARRILATEESDLQTLSRRIQELRQNIETQRQALVQLEEEQAPVRAEVETERAAIDEQLAAAREKRAAKANRVSRPLLAKYDRIRMRRKGEQALYALRGPSCGSCDTAIPLHRRNQMAARGDVEICEACGALLYATN